MNGLGGKKALVTGAAGGIGQAIVSALQAQGVTVAGSDRLAGAGDHFLEGDLTDPTFVDGLPDAAHAALGGLDIVVNNAGIITRGVIT